MMPLLARAQQLNFPVGWLVRAAHNRCLPECNKLWPHTTQGHPLGQIEFSEAARPGTKARIVRQHLWARRVELRADRNKTVSATCIVAREYDALAGAKPVERRILTNRVATDVVAVSELIDWYRARWEIEMLFNVLKNGCCVEELQLGTIERIERALALYLVVAWDRSPDAHGAHLSGFGSSPVLRSR